MKKYTLLSIILVGFSIASFGQTKKELKKMKRKNAKMEIVQEKKVEEVKAKVVPFVGDPATPITFTNMVIERNDIPKGTDDMFSFQFRNTGVDSLSIVHVQTSCGCTTAKKPEGKIAPGEYSEISVKYDTHRMGSFTKTITVTTDKSEPIVLTIKGSVLTPPADETKPAEQQSH